MKESMNETEATSFPQPVADENRRLRLLEG